MEVGLILVRTALLATAVIAAVVALQLLASLALRRWREVCPKCRKRALRECAFLRATPLPYGLYRCEHCSSRLLRQLQGPWQDASHPVHDHAFAGIAPPVRSYRRQD